MCKIIHKMAEVESLSFVEVSKGVKPPKLELCWSSWRTPEPRTHEGPGYSVNNNSIFFYGSEIPLNYVRYVTIRSRLFENVSRFVTDPQKVYLDPRYGSKIAIQCTTVPRENRYTAHSTVLLTPPSRAASSLLHTTVLPKRGSCQYLSLNTPFLAAALQIRMHVVAIAS